jgi:MFS family permease
MEYGEYRDKKGRGNKLVQQYYQSGEKRPGQMVKIGNREIPRDLFMFFVISALLGLVAAVDNTSLANRLYEDLHFTVMQRSMVEMPRELPGLLTVLLFGLLNGLGDIRIAALANILGGIGLLLFGQTTGPFGLVLLFLVIYSTGQHLYLPLSSSIAMSFASGKQFGKRMGEVQAVGSFSIIVGSALLYLVYKVWQVSYSMTFSIAAGAMILAGLLFLTIGRDSKLIINQKAFVFRQEYKMYYVLAIVNGARKQITLTFAPWLIIDVFQQPVTTITALFLLVCVLSIGFKPWFGSLIDRRGERYALKLEAVVMFIACLGFAFAKDLFAPSVALIVVGVCYVLDKLMESAAMARATYVRRLARADSEISRTLSMGQSMDHIVSMFIPLAAGYAWYSGGAHGYVYVFIGGLVISVINYLIASYI